MAMYSRREVDTKHVEYFLPSPTNWAEVGKVVAALNRELGEARARYDDAVTVEAVGEEIVFRYKADETITSGRPSA